MSLEVSVSLLAFLPILSLVFVKREYSFVCCLACRNLPVDDTDKHTLLSLHSIETDIKLPHRFQQNLKITEYVSY